MTARIGFKIPTGAKGARLTAPISIPSNNSSQDSNRSYAKRRRALLSSFGEQSPLFSKGFPKKNAKLISQTRATPNLIEKYSSARDQQERAARQQRDWVEVFQHIVFKIEHRAVDHMGRRVADAHGIS